MGDHYGDHYIVRCRYCNKIMSQCRCPSGVKKVTLDTCELCATIKKTPDNDPFAAVHSAARNLAIKLDEWNDERATSAAVVSALLALLEAISKAPAAAPEENKV